MTELRTRKRFGLRLLRRIFASAAFLAIVGILVAGTGVAVTWGRFWDFRLGDPTSESCGNCHLLQNYVDTQHDESLLVSRHVQEGFGCVDCHETSLERQIHETIAYLKEDYKVPFVRAQYPMDTCFTCHAHTSYDQLAWRTTDLGVTDAQASGHSANPHQPPHYSELECNTCHRMHRPSVLLCSECHAYQFRFPVISQESGS